MKRPSKPSLRRFSSEDAYAVALAAYNAVTLEVNHIAGGLNRAIRAKAGCHNHLDGLETLCSACHAPITKAQAAARAAARRAAKAAVALPEAA